MNAETESAIPISYMIVFRNCASILLCFRDMTRKTTVDGPATATIAYLAIGGPARATCFIFLLIYCRQADIHMTTA